MATDATTGSQFQPGIDAMQKLQLENQAFQVATQGVSAAMSSAGIATNLITSAHSAASNAAKNVGQGMVESSRR